MSSHPNFPPQSPWRGNTGGNTGANTRYPPTRTAGGPQSPYERVDRAGPERWFSSNADSRQAHSLTTFAGRSEALNGGFGGGNAHALTTSSPGAMKPSSLRSRFSSTINEELEHQRGGSAGDEQMLGDNPSKSIHQFLKSQIDSELKEFDAYITTQFQASLDTMQQQLQTDFQNKFETLEIKLPEMVDERVLHTENLRESPRAAHGEFFVWSGSIGWRTNRSILTFFCTFRIVTDHPIFTHFRTCHAHARDHPVSGVHGGHQCVRMIVENVGRVTKSGLLTENGFSEQAIQTYWRLVSTEKWDVVFVEETVCETPGGLTRAAHGEQAAKPGGQDRPGGGRIVGVG